MATLTDKDRKFWKSSSLNLSSSVLHRGPYYTQIPSLRCMLADSIGTVGNISPFKSSSAWLKVKDAVHLEEKKKVKRNASASRRTSNVPALRVRQEKRTIDKRHKSRHK